MGVLAVILALNVSCWSFAALLFTLPSIRRYQFQTSLASSAYAVGGLVVVGMLIALYQMFQPHPTVASSGEKLPLVPVDPSKTGELGKLWK